MGEMVGFSDIIKKSIMSSELSSTLSVSDIALILIATFVMGMFVFYIYRKTFQGVLYTASFNTSLVMVAMVTSVVIMTISSNIILSLGMVGALSIVRFRTAVKEPVELLYLFLSIAVGLGLGANQKGISIAAVVFIVGLIWINYLISDNKPLSNQRMVLTISSQGDDKKIQLDLVIELLERTCIFSNLIRLDEQEDSFEAHFDVEFDGLKGLNKFRESSYFIENNIGITILDNHGLI